MNNNLDNSTDWAKQAYAQLKQKQEQQKQEQQKLEQLVDKKDQDFNDTKPILGKFDEEFTWSAMVLAAQGKKVDQISLDEINWLSRLKKGLEKTRTTKARTTKNKKRSRFYY